jgi:hypothetical protein
LTDSTKTEPRLLDLDRDVPTTAEDIRRLRELRGSHDKDAWLLNFMRLRLGILGVNVMRQRELSICQLECIGIGARL